MGQTLESLPLDNSTVMDFSLDCDESSDSNNSMLTRSKAAHVRNCYLSSNPYCLFQRKTKDITHVPSVVTEIRVWDASEDIRMVRESVPIAACGCAVCPDNNNIVAAVCTFRHQLPSPRENTFVVPSAGFVSVWNLDCEETDEDISSMTSSGSFENEILIGMECYARNFTYSPLPPCKFSPNSELLTSILNSGNGTLSVLGRQKRDVPACYDVSKLRCDGIGGQNSLCGRTVCSFFSRNGEYMATISNVTLYSNRNIDVHELCMWLAKSNSHFQNMWQLGLDAACPRFRGYICTGKFSPDGKIVGLSSTRGNLMFVETETGLPSTDIQSCIEEVSEGSCVFDFDPRFRHSVLSIGYWSGTVKICRSDDAITRELFRYKFPSEAKLCSLSYNFDGLLLAIGSSSGEIHVLNTDYGRIAFVLDLTKSNIDALNRDACVMDLQYMHSCQELLAAYSDGIVRVWQLPRILDLQHICRLKIRSIVAGKDINELPVSEGLRKFLLYAPRHS